MLNWEYLGSAVFIKVTFLVSKFSIKIYSYDQLYNFVIVIDKFFKVLHHVKSVRIRSYSGPYSVRMKKNTGQNNSEYGHFARNVGLSSQSVISLRFLLTSRHCYYDFFMMRHALIRMCPKDWVFAFPNTGKYLPEKTLYLDTSHAMPIFFLLTDLICVLSQLFYPS